MKVFKTPDGSYWFGHGDGNLCSPEPEFLKQHNAFIVLSHTGQTLIYRHLDAKDNNWVFPFNHYIIGWVPLLEGADREDNRDLQRFLAMNTPASGEAIELSDIRLLDKGVVRVEVRTPISTSVFLSITPKPFPPPLTSQLA